MLNSTEHEIIMLINVQMSLVVGILTFISMIIKISESLKARKCFYSIKLVMSRIVDLSMKKVYTEHQTLVVLIVSQWRPVCPPFASSMLSHFIVRCHCFFSYQFSR